MESLDRVLFLVIERGSLLPSAKSIETVLPYSGVDCEIGKIATKRNNPIEKRF